MAKGFRNWLRKYGAWAPAIILLGIVAVFVFAYVIPYVFIWALNTLFNLNIPFNFWTWLAAVIILVIFGSKGMGK